VRRGGSSFASRKKCCFTRVLGFGGSLGLCGVSLCEPVRACVSKPVRMHVVLLFCLVLCLVLCLVMCFMLCMQEVYIYKLVCRWGRRCMFINLCRGYS